MSRNHLHVSPRSRRGGRSSQAGLGLIDALVALVILSFGMLALAGFQVRLLTQSTDANSRVVVSAFADELLNTVLVDSENSLCYQRPMPSACTSSGASAAAAASAAEAWSQRVASAVPGFLSASAALQDSGRRLTVSIRWTSKGKEADVRELETTTDVRSSF